MTITDALDIPLARLRVRYAKTPLPQFFAWWRGELVGLLPARWRVLVAERPQELLLDARPHEFGVWRSSSAGCADYGRIPLDVPSEEQRAEFLRLRGQIDEPNVRVFYCVPAERCLRRELTMPAATEDKLRQVLAFEMDRQTPFKADQVYFDYRIIERDIAAKNLKLHLTVLPRAQLDAEVSTLAACGIALSGVDCWRDAPGSGRAGLNLLSPERRAKHKDRRLRLNLALAAAALLLLVFAMEQSLANRQASLDAMTVEVEKAQNDAKRTAALAKQLQDHTASANFLFHMKHDTTTVTELLADLTKRLPDDTFLERLTIDEKGKVDVTGQSGNAAKLIDGLQKSEVLVDPKFIGTIQTDPRTRKERFNLTFQLRKWPQGEAERKDAKQADDRTDKRAEAGHASAT
ncbi:MAG TPA: PilN domain-containing protein [Rudaea sp.]|jgi:general secretion pathway protein L|uniref:PilN domain-containing protein n=1 Tax=Rudaea sp. TaxID=2136325 RepID=UPI002F95832E